jgi:segregation and condensation protein A
MVMQQGIRETDSVPFLVQWNDESGSVSSGPLSLLWSLIESYKVDIFQVSLSRITKDFLGFIKLSNTLSIELGTEFTLMASNLVYLKSKALLPDPGFDEDNSTESALPKELVERLLEYKKFQQAGKKLLELEALAASVFRKEHSQHLAFSSEEDVWLDVSLVDLILSFKDIINKQMPDPEIPNILLASQEYNVDEKIEHITSLLRNRGEVYFSDIFYSSEPETMDIVISFLAVLELVKQGTIVAKQHQLFGDIKLISVP